MIFGKHTITEVSQLKNSLEWRVQQLNAVIGKLASATLAQDPTLASDWGNFLQRWIAARSMVESSILKQRAVVIAGTLGAMGTPSDSVIPDEDDWTALEKATSPTYPAFTPQDLPGLQQRINAIAPAVVSAIDWTTQPKQNAVDLDLAGYTAADSAAQSINQVAAATQKAANGFLADNWGKLLVGTAVVVGGAIVGKKIGVL